MTRYLIIPILTITLFTACKKKEDAVGQTTNVSESPITSSTDIGTGDTKNEVMTKLKKLDAQNIADTGELITAQIGPAGLKLDGKPLTTKIRVKYQFKDGKFATMFAEPVE